MELARRLCRSARRFQGCNAGLKVERGFRSAPGAKCLKTRAVGAGTVSAKPEGTEHVEARLKWFPPTPSALPVSFLRRTRGPVPFLRVPGRLLFRPPPQAPSPVPFTSARRFQGCNAGLKAERGFRSAPGVKCLKTRAVGAGTVSAKPEGTEHVEARLKEVPPHPFSPSGELLEKNPRPGPLPEGTGPPSFQASASGSFLGAFHICKAISGLQCRAESRAGFLERPWRQVPENTSRWGWHGKC